ncbi:DUF1080 domain-containing protein, partial [candidate division KSB1 bacterium]
MMRRALLIIAPFFFIVALCLSQQMRPADTEVWEPEPRVVTPGDVDSAPPSDAIVLFDGTDLSQWQDRKGDPPRWKVEDGAVIV